MYICTFRIGGENDKQLIMLVNIHELKTKIMTIDRY